ncbi:hypothetical protein G7072_04290 [Nocardioides sp. HDW12B]|uniref:hypothetical protein n=1 Tax=Nocardioides sp. HDW12B TaxID=2714939 RepID=UPI00140DE9D7|nr:hypothetical protein [Nocardioides sp. HDW12B]QIK65661.1 hypothetical protein G7072_04290 [Nocardioides sp. HDW12B]
MTTGSLAVEVCDAGDCASATTRLGRVPGGPVAREAVVTFDELGRDFETGEVTVTVRLSDARDATVAMAERPVELTPFFPNGASCDGDGYVSGQLRMTTADRR